MTALILDAGALIAIERDDPVAYKKIQNALRVGRPVRTNPNAVAQVWRDGGKQARLAKTLRVVEVVPITREDGVRAGELLGATRTKDVVDATVALLAKSGDEVYTSDISDLRKLCEATGIKAVVIGC
jgi:predicted nucleic acid-binding protein